MVPLIIHEDYADVLLLKKGDVPPGKLIIWVQTTWEGGKRPVKVAPHTSGMLKAYKDNALTCLMITTSKGRGGSDIGIGDAFLYSLVPLLYTMGLIPPGLSDELHIESLPLVDETVNMTSSEQNKKRFKMGLGKGIDFFFGVGSVAYSVSISIASLPEDGKKGGSFLKELFTMPPFMTLQYPRVKK